MGRLIYGGSFNPLHIAHLRFAIECTEMLSSLAQGLDFVPAAKPPHKNSETLLPFAMRVEMIQAAIKDLPRMFCNELEKYRNGPAYTCDTLKEYHAALPGEQLYFLVGSQDYALLPQWRNGLDLPGLCNLVIIPRGDFRRDDFIALTRQMWPNSIRSDGLLTAIRHTAEDSACMRIEGAGAIYFLPVPWLDISSSYIRKLWLDGRDIRYLVPDGTAAILERERQTVMSCWRINP